MKIKKISNLYYFSRWTLIQFTLMSSYPTAVTQLTINCHWITQLSSNCHHSTAGHPLSSLNCHPITITQLSSNSHHSTVITQLSSNTHHSTVIQLSSLNCHPTFITQISSLFNTGFFLSWFQLEETILKTYPWNFIPALYYKKYV